MDYLMDDAIKIIKQQENVIEAKLRQKRTYEETVIVTKRQIREALTKATIQKQKDSEALLRIQSLNGQLSLERIRSKALAAQLETSKKELDDLKQKSDEGISFVWKLRSSLTKAVQSTSDQCDVWALLIKPQTALNVPLKRREASNRDEVLNLAREKLQKLVAERDRLMNEPDTGEEFIRIKNAISYSTQKVAEINK